MFASVRTGADEGGFYGFMVGGVSGGALRSARPERAPPSRQPRGAFGRATRL